LRRSNDWAVRGTVDVTAKPVLARVLSRERFVAGNGREYLRWTFVAWLRPGLGEVVVATGVTGTGGRRHAAWYEAVSRSGYCRVQLEERDGEDGIEFRVADLAPVIRMSIGRLNEYVSQAEELVAESVLT
jgi:hypothetical protein